EASLGQTQRAQRQPHISGRGMDEALARLIHPLSRPSKLRDYLSFLSLLPSISNSRFSPPNSAAPFPLSLSPSIFSVYSTAISLPINFRTAEKVRVSPFSLKSLSFVSSWSGQVIVPVRLSPSFLTFKVDVRSWSPI